MWYAVNRLGNRCRDIAAGEYQIFVLLRQQDDVRMLGETRIVKLTVRP
jgi:hypothetical protein